METVSYANWTSDDTNVATVSPFGTVNALMDGTTTLRVDYTGYNGETVSAFVTVKVGYTGDEPLIEILDSNGEMVNYAVVEGYVGDSFDFTVRVIDPTTGEEISEPAVSWTAEGLGLIRADNNGHVELIGEGNEILYVEYTHTDGFTYRTEVIFFGLVDVNKDSDTIVRFMVGDLANPHVGEYPDYEAVLTYSGYSLFNPVGTEYDAYVKNGIAWYDSTAKKYLVPDVDVIEEDRLYSIRVFLQADEGKSFTTATDIP